MRTLSFSPSMSGGRSTTVMEDGGNRINTNGELIGSTETDDPEEILSESEPVLTQCSVVGELSIPITNVVYYAFASVRKCWVMCLWVKALGTTRTSE